MPLSPDLVVSAQQLLPGDLCCLTERGAHESRAAVRLLLAAQQQPHGQTIRLLWALADGSVISRLCPSDVDIWRRLASAP